MISLSVLFYVLLALFILIGAMRGFGKEIVVCASSVLALFTIEVVIPRIFGATSGAKRFWINTIVIVVCAFAGYQTPNLRRFAENIRFQRGAFRHPHRRADGRYQRLHSHQFSLVLPGRSELPFQAIRPRPGNRDGPERRENPGIRVSNLYARAGDLLRDGHRFLFDN